MTFMRSPIDAFDIPSRPDASIELDSSQWEGRVGSQLRTLRLDAGHDQQTLANLADVGLSALKNLENGRGSTLRTLIRVLRALDAERWLDTLAPEPSVSPLDLLRGQGQNPRRRVYRARSPRLPGDGELSHDAGLPGDGDV